MFENITKRVLDFKIEMAYYWLRRQIIRIGRNAESIQEVRDRIDEIRKIEDFFRKDRRKLLAGMLLQEEMPYYDPEEGLTLMTELAEEGVPDCQFALGILFYHGQMGIPQDRILAKYWIDKAEDGGYIWEN